MKFALIGFPISYSLSPKIHREFAAQFNIELDYQLIPTTPDNLASTITKLQQQGYRGVNVTQPLKQLVLSYASLQSTSVQYTHAANTLSFEKNNLIQADNTDGIGFYNALKNHVPHAIKNKTVLLIGSGGAARGILPELLRLQPKKILLLNRTNAHAMSLLAQYPDLALYNLEQDYQWIINATTLPCYELPDTFPNLTFDSKIFYDLTYNHDVIKRQQFLDGHKQTAMYDGLSMLIEQAAAAYSTWHGVTPKTQELVDKMAV